MASFLPLVRGGMTWHQTSSRAAVPVNPTTTTAGRCPPPFASSTLEPWATPVRWPHVRIHPRERKVPEPRTRPCRRAASARATGRAIVRQVQVFLMDEPVSNLKTAVVTHDQVEALTMGDRVALPQARRSARGGHPREAFARPANAFVYGLIGSPAMNIFRLTRPGGHGTGWSPPAVAPLPRRRHRGGHHRPGRQHLSQGTARAHRAAHRGRHTLSRRGPLRDCRQRRDRRPRTGAATVGSRRGGGPASATRDLRPLPPSPALREPRR